MLSFLRELSERRRFGMHPGLESIKLLLARLGNPQAEIAALHIAGTNGKGAVAALCASAIEAAGYPVARYTSPHLVRVNERFFINGVAVSDSALEAAAQEVKPHVRAMERDGNREITFFELLTAVAFVLFRRAGIKLAVIETGLGGRHDATNVVLPVLSVITRIGLDHCAWLGNTIEEVAAEKAGIIKERRPVVCGAMPIAAHNVIMKAADALHAPFVDAQESVTVSCSQHSLTGQTLHISTPTRTLPPIHLPLAGTFQAENACTAVAALETLATCGVPLPDSAIVKGFESVRWPGRFQLAAPTPPVIVDGAHNPAAALALRQALKSCRLKKPVALVAGFCGDKDAAGHLRELAPITRSAWAVPIANPRSLPPEQTAELMRMVGISSVNVSAVLTTALTDARQWATDNSGIVVVTGSLFLAGEALLALNAWPWPDGRSDPNETLGQLNIPNP